MAEKKPNTKDKKPKRRLRAAPTLREQTLKQGEQANKPRKIKRVASSKLFAPVRFIGKGLKQIGKSIATSRFGTLIVAIAKSRPLAPVRFIFKILGKILLVGYFKNSWKELRLVQWPDSRTTWRLTGAVLIFAIIFGLMIAGLDFVLEKGFREVLLGS